MTAEFEFCLLVEAGVLERQALLLCESIRHFAGPYADMPLTVISPRPSRRPAASTVQRLLQFGANYVPLNLKSQTPEYGPSYKTLALGWRARQSGPDILVQLDSDTIFLDAPDLALNGHVAIARPVDVKGMCSAGPSDSFEPIWQRMCNICGVDIETLGYVTSTVDKLTLRANFNGGLVVARRHVFNVAEECFLSIVADDIHPFADIDSGMKSGSGPVSPAGRKSWGLTQAALSLAVAKLGGTVGQMDGGTNIPMHLLERIEPPPTRVTHLHYHWIFAGDNDNNPVFNGRLALRPDQAGWLRAHLPLK
jgi:hypothetical protein